MCELSAITRSYLEYRTGDLAEMILDIGREDEQSNTVSLLVAYMIKKGLVFKKDLSDDKDPRAILHGGTSVRYHHSTKVSCSGNKIILYCHKDRKDRDAIVSEMGKVDFDNLRSDSTRHFGIAFEPYEFLQAVRILTRNGKNTSE